MKKRIILVLIFSYTFGYSQNDKLNKWYSTADIEFIVPNKVEYNYAQFSSNYNAYIGGHKNFENTGASFGVNYSMNYTVFKKLSIGILTGYQMQNNPDFSMIKIGGVIRYFFVDNENVYTYISLPVFDLSLNKDQFKNGTNARIGIGFPIVKFDKMSLNLNVFYEVNDLDLDDGKPLIFDEIPRSIIFRSYGISAGIKF